MNPQSMQLMQDVVAGEDEETESEEEEEEEEVDTPMVEYEMIHKKENVQQPIQKDDGVALNKEINIMDMASISNNKSDPNEDKKHTKPQQNTVNIEPQKQSQRSAKLNIHSQFKEIQPLSPFDAFKLEFDKIMKSGKELVEKTFVKSNIKTRGIWHNTVFDATTAFHEKSLKSISCNLNKFKKQTEKGTSECQQSVSDLHQATGQIDKANKQIHSFCSDQYSLTQLFNDTEAK